MLLRARHGDVQQPALLLELLVVAEVVVATGSGRRPARSRTPCATRDPSPSGWSRASAGPRPRSSAASTSPTLSVGGSSAMSVSSERQAAIARRDGDEVLEVLLALRVVVGMEVPQHRLVVADDRRHLLARARSSDATSAQERRRAAPSSFVYAPRRGYVRQALGRARRASAARADVAADRRRRSSARARRAAAGRDATTPRRAGSRPRAGARARP